MQQPSMGPWSATQGVNTVPINPMMTPRQVYPPVINQHASTYDRVDPLSLYNTNTVMGAGINPQLPGIVHDSAGMSNQQQMRMPLDTSGVRMMPPNIRRPHVQLDNTSSHSTGQMYPPSAFNQHVTFGQGNRMDPMTLYSPNMAVGAGTNRQLISGMSAAYPGMIQYPSGMSKQRQMRMPSTTSGVRMVLPPNIRTRHVQPNNTNSRSTPFQSSSISNPNDMLTIQDTSSSTKQSTTAIAEQATYTLPFYQFPSSQVRNSLLQQM